MNGGGFFQGFPPIGNGKKNATREKKKGARGAEKETGRNGAYFRGEQAQGAKVCSLLL